MKRFLSATLILMTLWMSTWLVTDIHVVYAGDGDHPHPVFSIQADDAGSHASDHPAGEGTQDHHRCHFCSYDHGGHVGAMVLPEQLDLFCPHLPSGYLSPYFHSCSPHHHPPKLRPPIV